MLRHDTVKAVDAVQAELVCNGDRLAFPIRDDIPVMLVDSARPLEADEEVA